MGQFNRHWWHSIFLLFPYHHVSIEKQLYTSWKPTHLQFDLLINYQTLNLQVFGQTLIAVIGSHNQTLTGRPSFKVCLGRTTFSLNREHFIPVCSSLSLASLFSLLFCEFEPNPVSNSNSVNSKGLVLHFYKVRGRDIQTFSL